MVGHKRLTRRERWERYARSMGHTLFECDLSARAYNQLIRGGVYTQARVREMTDEELLRIPRIGVGLVREIREKLPYGGRSEGHTAQPGREPEG